MCQEIAPVRYEIQREVGSGSGRFITVFASTDVHNTNNPSWQPQKMRLTKFSNGSTSARVKIAFMCKKKEVGHIFVNATNLQDVKSYKVLNGGGTITFNDFQLLEVPSFVDYLRGGW